MASEMELPHQADEIVKMAVDVPNRTGKVPAIDPEPKCVPGNGSMTADRKYQ
jgi:hypothetical protein